MYISDGSPVTLTGTQEPNLARTASISPVPVSCHPQCAVPSRRNNASIHIFMTVAESVRKDYHIQLFLQPSL